MTLCPAEKVSESGHAPHGRHVSGFVARFWLADVLRSALRHGIEPKDIQHVLRNAVVVEDVAEDPTRYLVLGADRSGQLLELVVMDRSQGAAVLHAMAMRANARGLLPKGW